MRRPRLTILGCAAVASLAVVGAASAAHADPVNAKRAFPLTVVCDNGTTYSAIANGNGDFTPAHDLNSNSILVPVAFGPTTATVTDANGNVVATETQPASSKGSSSSNPNATTQCSFSGSSTDPSTGNTFTLSGTVLGFVTPSGG